jgi:integrase
MTNTEVMAKKAAAKPRDNDGLQRRRGVWHYKIKMGGNWREVSARTRNYQEARRIRQRGLKEQREGRLPRDFAEWTFDKASEQWLEARAQHVSRKTQQTEHERVRALLKFFGGRRLDEITAQDLAAYQVKRATEVSAKTINLDCGVLRMILRSAKLWARVSDDYKALPLNKCGPGRALTPNEEQELFQVASTNPSWNAAFYAAVLASNTTARGCELKGLRLKDVDLISQTLNIRRSTTKSDAGCRIIPLNESAVWAAARLLERARLLGAAEPSHFLFPSARFRHTQEGRNVAGMGYDPTSPVRSWRTAWRSLTKAARLPGLRFHDLRHHCITRLAEAGVPEQTLMSIAGHVSRGCWSTTRTSECGQSGRQLQQFKRLALACRWSLRVRA